MSVQSFANEFKELIVSIKNKGTAAIYCDNLIAYLEEVSKQPTHEPTDAELEQYKAQLQHDIELSKNDHATNLEMFRSVISSGQNAIRSSFLLNGGASVALLAFISHLTTSKVEKVASFADALIPFVIGVLAITITAGLTYLSQWFYAHDTKASIRTGFILNIIIIILGLASYGFFIWGMCVTYENFKTFM